MSYTTQDKILTYLGLSALPSPLTSLTDFINSVTAFINKYCNRTFEASASVKYYDGDGSKTVLIDDITSLTKFEILDEDGNVDYLFDDTSYYFLEPINEEFKNKIIINSYNAPIGHFIKGHQNIKVTAVFGHSITVPYDIELVATKLVAEILSDYNVSGGDVQSERLGEYQVTYQSLTNAVDNLGIRKILDSYRRLSV